MFFLHMAELTRRIGECFIPRHLAPRVANFGTDHRLGDAVRVRCVTPRKTTFDTRMTFVGMTVFPRHHTYDFTTLHLSVETATHTAVCACRRHGMFGLTFFND